MSKKLDTRGIAVLIIPVRKATFIVLTSLATSILSKLSTFFYTPKTTMSLKNISAFLLPYPAPLQFIKAMRSL